MVKKYSDTEGCTPVLSGILLEGLFAEMLSQIKLSLDCCQPGVREATSLSLEENMAVVANVTGGEIDLVLDITKNHSTASLNKKHGPFVKRLRQFRADLSDIEVDKDKVESLQSFLLTLTNWLQDAHVILMEDTPKEIRKYVSEKSGYDKEKTKPAFHVLPGGHRDATGGSGGSSPSGGSSTQGSEGEDERAVDGGDSGGVRKRDSNRKARGKTRLKLADDTSVEVEGEVGAEPGSDDGLHPESGEGVDTPEG